MPIICLEGLDKLGKTTTAKLLSEKIYNSRIVKFPTKKIPITDDANFDMDNFIEDLSTVARGFQFPDTIILDRYVMSTFAYQVAGRKTLLTYEQYLSLSVIPKPTITILFQGVPLAPYDKDDLANIFDLEDVERAYDAMPRDITVTRLESPDQCIVSYTGEPVSYKCYGKEHLTVMLYNYYVKTLGFKL